MNFDFSDEQKLLRQTAREYLEAHAPLSVCRGVLESDASYSEALWKGIGALGWPATAIPEEYGGAGFGYLELAVLAEELGRVLAPVPFSSSIYLAEALLLANQGTEGGLLPRFATGECIGVCARGTCRQHGPERVATTFAGNKLSGTKVAVVDGDVAHQPS
jgi:acyl-CoA dehydrogenase